jgi:hypothetical protein
VKVNKHCCPGRIIENTNYDLKEIQIKEYNYNSQKTIIETNLRNAEILKAMQLTDK